MGPLDLGSDLSESHSLFIEFRCRFGDYRLDLGDRLTLLYLQLIHHRLPSGSQPRQPFIQLADFLVDFRHHNTQMCFHFHFCLRPFSCKLSSELPKSFFCRGGRCSGHGDVLGVQTTKYLYLQ